MSKKKLDNYETVVIARLNPKSNQRQVVYDPCYISPCLLAAMGEGGGTSPSRSHI